MFIAQTSSPVSPIRYFDEVVGFGASIYESKHLYGGAPVAVDLDHVQEWDWIYDEEMPLLLEALTHWAWCDERKTLTVIKNTAPTHEGAEWCLVISGFPACPLRKAA